MDGQAKLRAKQRTEQPSQTRGHPQPTSSTCVSRVTWGPSQVVLIPDQSEGCHKGSYKGLVENAQNVPVHFGSKGETAQNVPVHFVSKVRRPVEDAQNVPLHFNKPDK